MVRSLRSFSLFTFVQLRSVRSLVLVSLRYVPGLRWFGLRLVRWFVVTFGCILRLLVLTHHHVCFTFGWFVLLRSVYHVRSFTFGSPVRCGSFTFAFGSFVVVGLVCLLDVVWLVYVRFYVYTTFYTTGLRFG